MSSIVKSNDKVVLVAFGGRSPEHEVSVITGLQAMEVLEKKGYFVLPLYITKTGCWLSGEEIKTLSCYKNEKNIYRHGIPTTIGVNSYGQGAITLKKTSWFQKEKVYIIDVICIAFHGSEGENGGFQGLCELFNIAYTGCGPLASSLAMNKSETRRWCMWHGIPVIPSVSVFLSQWKKNKTKTIKDILTKIYFPMIIKPVGLGSSIGIGVVHNEDELIMQVDESYHYDDCLLIERFILPCKEINCAVLGSPDAYKLSVCESPLSRGNWLDYSDKYEHGSESHKGIAASRRQIPAQISKEKEIEVDKMARKTAQAFGLYGVTRIDFLYDLVNDKIFVNELNTIPGSFAYYLWEASQMSFGELMEELLQIARNRHIHMQTKVRHFDTNLLTDRAKGGIKGIK